MLVNPKDMFVLNASPVHDQQLRALRLEARTQTLVSLLWRAITTSVEINRGIAALWPSMDRQVAFFDHHHATHALRRKPLKYFAHHSRAGGFCCISEQDFYLAQIIKDARGTPQILGQPMAPKRTDVMTACKFF